MQQYIFPVGLLVSLVLSTIGAYFSRRFKFDYSALALCCFVNYFMTGYSAAQFFTLHASLGMAVSLALVDCTLGADLSKKIGYYSRVPHKNRLGVASIEASMIVIIAAGMMGLFGAYVAGIPFDLG